MSNKPSRLRSVLAIICLCGSLLPGLASAKTCEKISGLKFTQDNTVTGLKDKQLYMYVDLSSDAEALRCLTEPVIIKMVLKAAQEAAEKSWVQSKFAHTNNGVIDVITILNKDEYAKADFASALRHGQVKFVRKNAKVAVESNSLTFKNLLSAKFSARK